MSCSVPNPLASAESTTTFQRDLRSWFKRNGRQLPWRKTVDPFEIWVSEIMLQQTQVATVIPFYHRFLARFPDIVTLASAAEQDVLAHWQGLGYYRRARNLQRAAKAIVQEHNGAMPTSVAELQRLPGIGKYTAHAIATFSYNAAEAILEANTSRVIARLLAIGDQLSNSKTQKLLWDRAEAMLPRSDPGEYNQALIELGALVCTAAAPDCDRCPVSSLCASRHLGLQGQIPAQQLRKQTVAINHVCGWIERRGKVLAGKIPVDQWWSGLWELPRVEIESGSTSEVEQQILQRTGLTVKAGPSIASLKHSVTHHRIQLCCRWMELQRGRIHSRYYATLCWKRPEQLAQLPLSTPQRRVIKRVLRDGVSFLSGLG